MASAESEVRALLDSRSEAVWTKDLDRLLSFYAPDVIYFDIPAPLRYIGSDALRGRFTEWFESYKSPIRQELHDVDILASGDVAAACMLIRAGGTLMSGQEVELGVRATSCFQRSDDGWLIRHEHISLPSDLASGRAVTNLVP